MKISNCALVLLSAAISTMAIAAPPEGKGGGKGGGGEEPPAEPFEPAFVHTLTGKPATLVAANWDFSASKTITDMSDGRTRGMDHAPDEGRVLVDEARVLYETSYSVAADGTLTETGRTELFDGNNSASNLRCIAVGEYGAYAYSLTSAVGGELKIKSSSGQIKTLYDVGNLESCDFTADGASIIAIENLDGDGGFEVVEIDIATGAATTLMTAPEAELSLQEIDASADGESYLISWTDRSSSNWVTKISEWGPGESLPNNPVVATDASGARFACDRDGDGLTDDGYIYQSSAGRDPVWIEDTADGARDLIVSKGNRGVYHLRPNC